MKLRDIKRVKIGNYYYKLKFVSNKKLRKVMDDKRHYYAGCIVYFKGKIYLNEKVDDEHLLGVLMHEVMHGIFFERNVNVNRKDNEEVIVEDGAQGLIQFIRENPKVIELIMEEK